MSRRRGPGRRSRRTGGHGESFNGGGAGGGTGVASGTRRADCRSQGRPGAAAHSIRSKLRTAPQALPAAGGGGPGGRVGFGGHRWEHAGSGGTTWGRVGPAGSPAAVGAWPAEGAGRGQAGAARGGARDRPAEGRGEGGAWRGTRAGRGLPQAPRGRQLGEGSAAARVPPAGTGQAAAGVPWGWAGSVVLEERQQVIAVVRGEVGRAQVGQQLVRVGQFWEQLRTEHTGLGPAPRGGRPAPTAQPELR